MLLLLLVIRNSTSYHFTLFFIFLRPPRSLLFPYTTLFRSEDVGLEQLEPLVVRAMLLIEREPAPLRGGQDRVQTPAERRDRKSKRLNSSHQIISYALFCFKKKRQDSSNSMRTLF